eukprot:1048519-Pyramimonas_sp.AAC.1
MHGVLQEQRADAVSDADKRPALLDKAHGPRDGQAELDRCAPVPRWARHRLVRPQPPPVRFPCRFQSH